MTPLARHPRTALPLPRRLGTLAVALLASTVAAQGASVAPLADLPVTRLVATTSGLATFEHAGTVTGSQELLLKVPEDAMDEIGRAHV
jgi:hypothetical protein